MFMSFLLYFNYHYSYALIVKYLFKRVNAIGGFLGLLWRIYRTALILLRTPIMDGTFVANKLETIAFKI